MKNMNLFYSILLLFNSAFSQNKITTKNGNILFEASIPAFEEVKASNSNVSCIVNTKTGEISSLAYIDEFKFKTEMMHRHFNDNYLESYKYPKAIFKGKIQGFNLAVIENSPKEYIMSGKLSMHGKTRAILTIVMIQKTDNGLQITTNFKVRTSDFGVKIPKIIQYKIAESVSIKSVFLML